MGEVVKPMDKQKVLVKVCSCFTAHVFVTVTVTVNLHVALIIVGCSIDTTCVVLKVELIK